MGRPTTHNRGFNWDGRPINHTGRSVCLIQCWITKLKKTGGKMKTFKGSINDTKATLIKKAENNAWENYDAGLRRGREQIFKAMREDVQLVEEYAKAIRHTYEL